MLTVFATAYTEDKEVEFTFEVEDGTTNDAIVDKAFELAYCAYIELERVVVDAVEKD